MTITVENLNKVPILNSAIADQTGKVNSTFTFTLPENTFSDLDAVNPYKNLVIFGDSLSDTGNAYQASGNTFPPPPNYQGRLSNGLIWIDYLARNLQFTDQSIENFAFSGANTGVSNTFGQITVPGLLTQIQQFKTLNTATPVGKDGLYVIWAGGNDFLNLATNPTQAITNAVTNISSAITTLAELGAKEIVVGNLPDLGATPLSIANNNVDNARLISIGFNAALTQALTNLEPVLNVDLSLVDIFGLSAAFQANPASYNFTNITQPLITATNPVDPNQYAFWDDFHPTTKLHQLFTATFENTLLNEGVIPDLIKYSATLADGSNLPDWLNFNSTTRTFTGTPKTANIGQLNVKVIATDKDGANVSDIFTLYVENVNNTPTNITINNSNIAENQAIGTVIGNLSTTDPDTGNTFTYSLVSGTGATDNSLFTISGNQLKTNSVFNFETKNSYSIRVKTTDQGGLSFEKQLTIGVSNVNETPTNLTLSTSTVAENKTVGTVVGNLSSTDPDANNTFTYSLVSGTGATDNSLFTISGNQLKTNSVFNFETKNSYSIRVKTTDQGGLSFEKQLTIGVSNVNETPTNLTLSTSTIAENQIIGTVVGNLSTTDPDTANTFTYSLVTGTGATDNSLFTISGNQLKTNSVFDFETKNSYSIRVQTRDQGGLTYQKQLTINISNLTDNTITGTANTNNITTTNDKDIIDAVAGNDTITSVFTNLQQNDNINGGLGTDTLIITGGTSANSLTINANNTTNQIGNIPGTTVLGFERFDLSTFTGNVNFTGTDGNDWIKGGSGTGNLSGGKGNDSLYLGSDTAVDNVNYVLGHGTDTVYQFVRGAGGDKLNFTGIANFDVITSGNSTLVRAGDGIIGNTGFGTGQSLVTLSGTSGFNSTNASLNLFGGNFLFS
ncbi:cadherin domain-containing protein [Anabaena sp. FACHB-1391]|uniref:cadherin domain-containing protein n=1 Tax=Anabaena sp. FACHB-1391 TaxID=2692771 RepID=UPI00168154EE|nr:cadherin domain-containing protein [Anabaena sp. FACHB-1391]MBD2269793.1 cadherin domain-containing protein [Anabaena sp. FACHB-1391]